MQLATGTRLGPYEVLSALGAGGMGEVYRARDTKLGRDVALKILPRSFADDPDRLTRFQREARVLAALNHPNVAAIYGLEETTDVKALVLELVEGATLAERITHGAIPVDECLSIAYQISQALVAAHERGIVHRDLKPANIKVRPDGTVKVLDFGLAKVGESKAGGTDSPATTSHVLLGTAAYVAPERARSHAVDERADIWSFGCVLYEMLAGRRAFGGKDVFDTLAQIVDREPDWSLLPAETPETIHRLLQQCLAKEPRERLNDARDLGTELAGAVAPGSRAAAGRARLLPIARPPEIPSIAVLPFANLTADVENELFLRWNGG
jgi:serine/threonine protein kinase